MTDSQPVVAVPMVSPEISRQVLNTILDGLNDDELLLPLKVKREEVTRIKALKFSAEEVAFVDELQSYLYGEGLLREKTFTALVIYCLRLTYGYHRALELAKKEAT